MGIRVLHVLDKVSVDSGVSSVVMNYYAMLDQERITFDFMLNEEPEGETRAYIEGNGSKIFVMPGLKAANLLKYIKALKLFYRTHNYKIIHGHIPNSAIFYLGLARNSIPYRILHCHNTKAADIWWKSIRNWLLTRFVKQVTNKYIACSYDAAKFMFGVKTSVIIFNNVVDVEKFLFCDKKRERVRLDLALGGKLVIGHIGRFTRQKNHAFLIDVFYEVRKIIDNSALIMIGDGDLYENIAQKAQRLGVDSAILFLGVKYNVSDYMSAMDVFALPSLFEGLPVTGVEAQVNGLPCIFSNNVTKEVRITDDCLFLPTDNPIIWANEIVRLHNKGRITVERAQLAEFDIAVQGKRLAEYYEGLWERQQ